MHYPFANFNLRPTRLVWLWSWKSDTLYSKTCVKRPLSKSPKFGGCKTNYHLMQVKSITEGKHSAILSTFIKLPFVIKTFVLSIFEWPLYKGFTAPILTTTSRHQCWDIKASCGSPILGISIAGNIWCIFIPTFWQILIWWMYLNLIYLYYIYSRLMDVKLNYWTAMIYRGSSVTTGR